MQDDFERLAGAAWLIDRYALRVAQPLAVSSSLGTRRSSVSVNGLVREVYPWSMRPDPDLRGHLTFHLKHEPPHLEMLARLFGAIDPQELLAWVRDEPTGQYARRAGFLYEWWTGRQLDVRVPGHAPAVRALDAARVVVASPDREVLSRRWRVRDNMPGTPAFCPMVRPQAGHALDVAGLLSELRAEFDEELLMRASVWMTLRESRSSFAIEGEGGRTDRIQRFATVLGRRTGVGDLPLTSEALAQLQGEILGTSTLERFGIRQSPVFVGQTVQFQNVVHYIAPPAEDVEAMLEGLRTFLERTEGQSAVMRAAVASFGFVYVHPLADGNGRVHRFLINDVLRRAGAVPDPYILPVSAQIQDDAAERRAYDRVLEVVSQPLMDLVGNAYRFAAEQQYPDGIRSNLEFTEDDLARPLWRHPDLTQHVTYLADVITRTVREQMREESRYLRRHAAARAAIKDIIEMPDSQADRVIRAIDGNAGKLSNVLLKEIPALAIEDRWERLVAAVRQAFQDAAPGEGESEGAEWGVHRPRS